MLPMVGVFYPTGYMFLMFATQADRSQAVVSLLADQGHSAMMIHAPSGEETTHVMDVLRHARISYAQKYRHLVIEDLA